MEWFGTDLTTKNLKFVKTSKTTAKKMAFLRRFLNSFSKDRNTVLLISVW